MVLETPRYSILKPLTSQKSWLHSGYVAEVRQYDPYVVAEVTVEGNDLSSALNTGFRQIANYIFGGNSKDSTGGSEKIAMTAPVGVASEHMSLRGGKGEKIAMTAPVGAETHDGGSSHKVWFMMPSKYTLETLPKPNNPNITFKEIPSQTLAAITFRGPGPREKKVEEKKAELEQLLAGSGYVPEGEPLLWQYDPPFKPWFLRHNEVLLKVHSQADAGASNTVDGQGEDTT